MSQWSVPQDSSIRRSAIGAAHLAAAGSFLVLNAAAWIAFWVWLFGGAGLSWSKVTYEAYGSVLDASPQTKPAETQPATAAS
jgi:hypothetical protein